MHVSTIGVSTMPRSNASLRSSIPNTTQPTELTKLLTDLPTWWGVWGQPPCPTWLDSGDTPDRGLPISRCKICWVWPIGTFRTCFYLGDSTTMSSCGSIRCASLATTWVDVRFPTERVLVRGGVGAVKARLRGFSPHCWLVWWRKLLDNNQCLEPCIIAPPP